MTDSTNQTTVISGLDTALRDMVTLTNREGVSHEYLAFHSNLVKFRKRAISRIVNTRHIIKHFTESYSLDNPVWNTRLADAIKLTLEEFDTFLEQGDFPETITTLVKALHTSDKELLVDWVTAIRTSSPQNISKIASKVSTDAGVLSFLGRELFKPYFHLLASHQYTEAKETEWQEGFCPVCHSYPQFGRLEKEEGALRLWCDLCNIQWTFERMTCPFCGSKDPEQSRYFTAQDKNISGPPKDPIRVQVCDKCQSYIKIYDERISELKLEQPLTEDVGSLALDMVAVQEGFVHPNVAMAFS